MRGLSPKRWRTRHHCTIGSLLGELLRHELQKATKCRGNTFRTCGESREAHTGEHFVLAACECLVMNLVTRFWRVSGGSHERGGGGGGGEGGGGEGGGGEVNKRGFLFVRIERRVCQPSPNQGDSLVLSNVADERRGAPTDE